jgi:hypothetical protein
MNSTVCKEKFESRPFRKVPGMMVAMRREQPGTLPEAKWPKLYSFFIGELLRK